MFYYVAIQTTINFHSFLNLECRIKEISLNNQNSTKNYP